MATFLFKACEIDLDKRLDLFLLERLNEAGYSCSRSGVQRLIRERCVESLTVVKSHVSVKPGQEFKVTVNKQEDRRPKAEEQALTIVFEDDDLVIINKPAGMVVHPAPGNTSHTLVNFLLSRYQNLSDIDPDRPGIVHRLDKDTSGLLLVAKNNFTHLALTKLFASREIKKTYVALVRGSVQFDEHIIEIPIRRNPNDRKSMSAGYSDDAKYAKTLYRTILRRDSFSLLELYPLTGRTHQLRVHLAFINHPIIGDLKYGKGKDAMRLMLHAKSLEFIHPRTGKRISVTAQMPQAFQHYIDTHEVNKK